MRAAKVLTRLSLAWSRDDEQKFYVQDRMREVGRDLWSWLADGANIRYCLRRCQAHGEDANCAGGYCCASGAQNLKQRLQLVAD